MNYVNFRQHFEEVNLWSTKCVKCVDTCRSTIDEDQQAAASLRHHVEENLFAFVSNLASDLTSEKALYAYIRSIYASIGSSTLDPCVLLRQICATTTLQGSKEYTRADKALEKNMRCSIYLEAYKCQLLFVGHSSSSKLTEMISSTLNLHHVVLCYSPRRRRHCQLCIRDGLWVEVTGPSSSVSSDKHLKSTAEVTNNGAEAVNALKYGTILDSLPTRSFTVSKDGASVNFSGVELSVALNNDNAYAAIETGKTVSVTHKG
ncbi:neutral protease 2 [Moniliophthora roreri MCA 2997]|uniref:Neutral protease 2 n=1 Tax=Moniliophthora roreri (strain MCA 2997) TaxID=1381753 RepID=V2W7E4_MONRO|nr:neutral protease 2 [Moniliophthora roreri MCA 2997]